MAEQNFIFVCYKIGNTKLQHHQKLKWTEENLLSVLFC